MIRLAALACLVGLTVAVVTTSRELNRSLSRVW